MSAESDDTLGEAIEGHIREYLASDDERLGWVRKAVRPHNFLPLYIGWLGAFGVQPDGTVVRWNHDDNIESGHLTVPEREDNPFWQRMALCEGARKYPVLAPLVPTRPTEAVGCESCNGTGDLPSTKRDGGAPICGCGGLGWIIPGEVQTPSPG